MFNNHSTQKIDKFNLCYSQDYTNIINFQMIDKIPDNNDKTFFYHAASNTNTFDSKADNGYCQYGKRLFPNL